MSFSPCGCACLRRNGHERPPIGGEGGEKQRELLRNAACPVGSLEALRAALATLFPRSCNLGRACSGNLLTLGL
ncbi:MAG: hypothetical protein RML93_02200 [Anaerolineales bacterium]|nr:hypothetical protein [Anaerolineales bacterium]MDW8446086.1 hypothetical protein [Anaerolineales bacterium]